MRASHAGATEIRYTDTPSQPWENWKTLVTIKNNVLLRGYPRKTEVFVRFRSVGGDPDDQEFSEVISCVVQ